MTCFAPLQVVVCVRVCVLCVCHSIRVDVREQLLEVVSHLPGLLLLLCVFPASVSGSQLSVGVLELQAFATELAFVAIIILMCVCVCLFVLTHM